MNRTSRAAFGQIGRGGKIRTCGLTVPNRAHYQAVLRPARDHLGNESKCRILRLETAQVKSNCPKTCVNTG